MLTLCHAVYFLCDIILINISLIITTVNGFSRVLIFPAQYIIGEAAAIFKMPPYCMSHCSPIFFHGGIVPLSLQCESVTVTSGILISCVTNRQLSSLTLQCYLDGVLQRTCKALLATSRMHAWYFFWKFTSQSTTYMYSNWAPKKPLMLHVVLAANQNICLH